MKWSMMQVNFSKKCVVSSTLAINIYSSATLRKNGGVILTIIYYKIYLTLIKR